MTKVKLWCGVYGEGSLFSVEIDHDAKVEALRKAIADQVSTKDYAVPARRVALYLARDKAGNWREGDVTLASFLKQGQQENSEYEDMIPFWKLKAYFGPEFHLGGAKAIHILVELPPREDPPPMDQLLEETSQKLKEIYESTVLRKRKRFVHSVVDSAQGKELLDDLNLRMEAVRTVPSDGMAAIEPFQWESVTAKSGTELVLSEEQQRERYRAYIKEHLRDTLTENRLTVLGVERRNLLSVHVKGTEIELAGRTDMLILSDIVGENPRDVTCFPDVKMLIEVKRQVLDSTVYQAMSELIALDLLAENDVVALLTDLNSVWIFLWVSDKKKNGCGRIHKATVKTPGEAFHVIRQIIATSEAELSSPCLEMPMKRQKLSRVLPSIGEAGADAGIRESIEQYYDIASILGPDVEMARAVARQIAQSIPTFSCFS